MFVDLMRKYVLSTSNRTTNESAFPSFFGRSINGVCISDDCVTLPFFSTTAAAAATTHHHCKGIFMIIILVLVGSDAVSLHRIYSRR